MTPLELQAYFQSAAFQNLPRDKQKAKLAELQNQAAMAAALAEGPPSPQKKNGPIGGFRDIRLNGRGGWFGKG